MGRSQGSPVRVLFIVGKGRSGSTILNSVLGGVPGFFGAGELIHLWDWGLGQGVRCGCGEDVLDCPLWSKVLAEGFGIHSRERDAERIEGILRDHRAIIRWRKAPRLLARHHVGRWAALRRYTARSAVLYRTIADITGAQAVVDSSKVPMNPAACGLVDGVEGAVVHLVRDPRAVVFSWQRAKEWSDRDEGAMMSRHSAVRTSASWLLVNLGAELTVRRWPRDRTMRLRYEEFSREPRSTVARLTEFAELPDADLPFVDAHTVRLGTNHTVGGNPDRMKSGEVAIRPDDAWEAQMGARTRHVISALTWPLRRRYSYDIPEKSPTVQR